MPPPEPLEPGIRIELSELEMLLSMLSGLLVFTIGALILGRSDSEPGHRAGALLWGLIGGLLTYIYTILQMPGSSLIIGMGSWAGLTATLLGSFAGWALYQVITSRVQQPAHRST